MQIRSAGPDDASAVSAIYNHYVQHTIISFETEPLSVETMQQRIGEISARYPYLVAEVDGELRGFAYLNQFRNRAAYGHCAEASVYVAVEHRRQGIGSRLFEALLEAAPVAGITEVISVLAMPNLASEGLHRRLGFTHQGRLHRVGRKFGHVIDIAYWQWSASGKG